MWAVRLVGVVPVEHATTSGTGESGEGAGPMQPWEDDVMNRLGSTKKQSNSHD